MMLKVKDTKQSLVAGHLEDNFFFLRGAESKSIQQRNKDESDRVKLKVNVGKSRVKIFVRGQKSILLILQNYIGLEERA